MCCCARGFCIVAAAVAWGWRAWTWKRWTVVLWTSQVCRWRRIRTTASRPAPPPSPSDILALHLHACVGESERERQRGDEKCLEGTDIIGKKEVHLCLLSVFEGGWTINWTLRERAFFWNRRCKRPTDYKTHRLKTRNGEIYPKKTSTTTKCAGNGQIDNGRAEKVERESVKERYTLIYIFFAWAILCISGNNCITTPPSLGVESTNILVVSRQIKRNGNLELHLSGESHHVRWYYFRNYFLPVTGKRSCHYRKIGNLCGERWNANCMRGIMCGTLRHSPNI